MKPKSIPQVLKEFIAQDQFNALFIYEALNRYAQYVMDLDPKDHERMMIFTMNYCHWLVEQELGKHEPIKAKIGEAQKI